MNLVQVAEEGVKPAQDEQKKTFFVLFLSLVISMGKII